MKTLAVVPARAGSRGVPGKNKRDFCGKPLVSWAIECGMRTCDRVVVTSDDADVLRIAREYGVEALERPASLAMDETPMLAVLQNVVEWDRSGADCLVLLQPTQPLRKDGAVKVATWMLEAERVDSVVSVVEIPAHMSPDYACYIRDDVDSLVVPKKATRRQDCRPAYYRDGTVYVIRAGLIRAGEMYGRCFPFVIPASESCTIDTEDDWARAEQMWRKQHGSV